MESAGRRPAPDAIVTRYGPDRKIRPVTGGKSKPPGAAGHGRPVDRLFRAGGPGPEAPSGRRRARGRAGSGRLGQARDGRRGRTGAMEIRLTGTGGRGGWPQPHCRCASCERARSAGRRRAPAQVLVDGVLRIDSGRSPVCGPDVRHRGDGTGGGDVTAGVAGYRVKRVLGGWDITGPDGGRLLVGNGHGGGRGGGHGATTAPPDGTGRYATEPYDIALLDLLENPAQLGALRRRGLVHARTVVAVLHADHRAPSEEELARRCQFWGVIVPHDGDVLVTPGTVTPGTATPGTATPGTATPGTATPGTATPGTATARPVSAGSGPGRPRRVLVLGGARSGKSRHAELRLAAEPRVTYLAAGPYPARAQPAPHSPWTPPVSAHRARRPPWLQTA